MYVYVYVYVYMYVYVYVYYMYMYTYIYIKSFGEQDKQKYENTSYRMFLNARFCAVEPTTLLKSALWRRKLS